MSRQAQTEDSVYMNVIPMVDIMFLLLLFFMLTADFGGRELEEVLLSRGASIKEDKQDEAKDRVNINVFHTTTVKDQGTVECPDYDAKKPCRNDSHWNIAIRGKRYGSQELESKAKDLARDFKKFKQNMSDAQAADTKIPTELRVMIRADMRVPFKFVQVCQEKLATAGIYKLEYGAAEPDKK
jgi:biopolymer transport protein ExbD